MTPKNVGRQRAFYGGLAVLVLLLVGADLVYFNSLDAGPATPAAAPEQTTQAPAVRSSACRYHPEKQPVANFDALVDATDPVEGNPEASVTIVEFFDPNCGHCKNFHPIMEETLAAYEDRIRVVYKPLAVWEYSLGQNAALFAAAEEDKFFDMLDLQFERQQRGGLTLEQVKAIAREVGMDADRMEQRIRSGLFNETVQKRQQQAREAGVTGVPAVILNGRFLAGSARTTKCLRELIDEALAQAGSEG